MPDTGYTWRDLALQFDHHRINALQVIRGLVSGETTQGEAEAFLAAPPLPGSAVLDAKVAEIAAERSNSSEQELPATEQMVKVLEDLASYYTLSKHKGELDYLIDNAAAALAAHKATLAVEQS